MLRYFVSLTSERIPLSTNHLDEMEDQEKPIYVLVRFVAAGRIRKHQIKVGLHRLSYVQELCQRILNQPHVATIRVFYNGKQLRPGSTIEDCHMKPDRFNLLYVHLTMGQYARFKTLNYGLCQKHTGLGRRLQYATLGLHRGLWRGLRSVGSAIGSAFSAFGYPVRYLYVRWLIVQQGQHVRWSSTDSINALWINDNCAVIPSDGYVNIDQNIQDE